eukprot:283752-Alexandrium_andersonii.AAC.1
MSHARATRHVTDKPTVFQPDSKAHIGRQGNSSAEGPHPPPLATGRWRLGVASPQRNTHCITDALIASLIAGRFTVYS